MIDKTESSRTELAVEAAMALMSSRMNPEYEPDEKFIEGIKGSLEPNEKVMFRIKQSFIQDIAPIFIVATSEKLMVINPSFWYRYTGVNILTPTESNLVHYPRIADIVIVRGRFLSSIVIKILGGGEVKIHGLRVREATFLMHFIEKVVENLEK